MGSLNVQEIMNTAQIWLAEFGFKFIGAIAIFIIGKWVAGFLSRMVSKMMGKQDVDSTLSKFVSKLIYFALLAIVILAALDQIGVETTSFVAILGAAGLAIGLALQGSLSNFASGVLMILFRPIKVGDLIEAAGALGVVEEISIFNTVLITPDNKTVIIPNAAVTSENIVNYTKQGKIRIDLVFGIGYEDDMKKARNIMMKVMEKDERVLKDPAPMVGLLELGDNSVNFAARPWVDPAVYWDVYFDTMETVKERFDAEGISIPYPQRDVHLYKHDGDS